MLANLSERTKAHTFLCRCIKRFQIDFVVNMEVKIKSGFCRSRQRMLKQKQMSNISAYYASNFSFQFRANFNTKRANAIYSISIPPLISY